MLAKLAIISIHLYRKLLPGRPLACRFYPSCSNYAQDAINLYGISGVFVAVARILRCNQFFKGGYDPII